MNRRIADDPRLDPRIKALLSAMPEETTRDVTDRDELLALATSPEALAQAEAAKMMMDLCDDETVAPSTGLRFATYEVSSSPDENTILLQLTRPDTDEQLACVYYIHGGGMMSLSSFYGNYRAWARIVAAKGVAVVMVEFRNAVWPSAVPEVAPYPAGLHDCVSGLRWVIDHANELGVDPARVIISGESGGGNLALATTMALVRSNDVHLVKGVYAMCPYIAGRWPDERLASSIENNGIFLNLHSNVGRVGYGIEAFEAKDPLAWPLFATEDDVRDFPPTVISVNECDPLRDEGVEFYRLLLRAGVAARGRQVLGTMHGTELAPILCPEISHDTARDLAAFATSPR
ncbi:MAG: alpha/beta hydrolase fold domain-containing protein [Acidobacteriota bacterium]|nr:alpha/beta hydrolase fold domain-containing protein [Acidobacteriota bacterium]